MGTLSSLLAEPSPSGNLCPYCLNIFGDSRRFSWDKILVETPNFIAVPTKGSIVPGWLLVIPRNHVHSFSGLSKDLLTEYMELQTQLEEVLEREFGPVFAFEHGAIADGSVVGCGVNHAHMHLVSLPFDLFDAVNRFAPFQYSWQSVQEHGAMRHLGQMQQAYYYLAAKGRPTWIAEAVDSAHPTSQFFRRVIASELGVPEKFDYRDHLFLGNVFRTISAFTRRPFVAEVSRVIEEREIVAV